MEPFRLSPATVRQVAAGTGGAATVDELRRAKLNDSMLLLRHLTDIGPGETQESFEVLSTAQKRDPAVVAHLLQEPWTVAWLADTARKADDGPLLRAQRRLGSLAAVAALRTGLDAVTVVPVAEGGRAMFPDLGMAVLNRHDGDAATARIRDSTLRVGGHPPVMADGTSADERWMPLRRLRFERNGQVLAVVLDDLDPQRDCHHHRPAPRLEQAALDRWSRTLATAWDLMTTFLPAWASQVAAATRVLVPLVPTSRAGLSVTATDAFGGLALTCPVDAAMAVTTLIHELQHSALNVLTRHHTFHRPGPARHFAPWRDDPRPTGGLLHGCLAFLGVADGWRGLRSAPGYSEVATREFARVREQVRSGLDTLAGSGDLTPVGLEFVGLLQERVAQLLAEPCPPWLVLRSRIALRRNRIAWSWRKRTGWSPRDRTVGNGPLVTSVAARCRSRRVAPALRATSPDGPGQVPPRTG